MKALACAVDIPVSPANAR